MFRLSKTAIIMLRILEMGGFLVINLIKCCV